MKILFCLLALLLKCTSSNASSEIYSNDNSPLTRIAMYTFESTSLKGEIDVHSIADKLCKAIHVSTQNCFYSIIPNERFHLDKTFVNVSIYINRDI